jgi:pyruvate/2-oxoglutarate dehydrogenase complex dihydrolipoamide acyltransferase (E2) component
MVAEDRTNEALEKLNRGIEESKQMVQQQTMKLAQDFFGDSVEETKQQIKENRATLEGLPDQIPGGQEESFQMLFQELMDNYEAIEQALDEAKKNVSELDTDRLMKQGEVDATDAARRQARELGVDLTELEGTGTDGRITVDDVKNFAESAQEDVEDAAGEATEEVTKASDAARRRAEEMGVDLSQIEGTGSGGLITVKDVTSAAGGAAQQATDTAGQAAGQATDAVGQTVAQADGAANQATQQAGNAAGGDEGPRATNAAKRKAEDLGIDLSQIQGSGAGGLITIRDVVKTWSDPGSSRTRWRGLT